MNKKTSDLKNVKKSRKIAVYKISKIPHRQNPAYKLKLKNGIPCKLCIEKQQDTTGHPKIYRSLNSLHGHCSFDHFNMDFKDWLISLAEKIISGELK